MLSNFPYQYAFKYSLSLLVAAVVIVIAVFLLLQVALAKPSQISQEIKVSLPAKTLDEATE